MKAFELLTDPSNWMKGGFAACADGSFAHPESHRAVRFNVVGALDRCYPDQSLPHSTLAIHLFGWPPVGPGLHRWNNDPARTHAEVLAVLKHLDL